MSALGATSALLVVDRKLAKADRHRRVVEELEKTSTRIEVLDSLTPTVEGVEAAKGRAQASNPDWIIAFGGGSTIDAAKGLWLRTAGPQRPLRELTPLVDLGLRPRTRFVAIPTTSGSGNEASWTCRLRSSEGRAVEVASRELVPDWALLDPGLPATMDPELTASSGAMLLANAFEAVASAWANPFSDSLARAAIGATMTNLPRAVRHPDDVEARSALHYAATMAGLAVSNSQAGFARALSDAFSDIFGIPSRKGLAVVLPYVLEFNFPSARDRYSLLSSELGSGATGSRSSIAERVRALYTSVGLPRTLVDLKIPAEQLEERVEDLVSHVEASTSVRANPRIPSRDELRQLIIALRTGASIGF
ncbi:MAG: iron-containing alcohol dehydrogenase [Thermoplasmata archaeon]|nr:iron-containing alcohol dehydrogenase [Thermoplasmata archaeon]